MFLYERGVSLAVYTLSLIIICCIISCVRARRIKTVLLIYLIILCSFAYFYNPYITADLYRVRQYIAYWSYLSWDGVVKYAISNSQPTWVLYSWILQQTGNINMLQTVTCCIVFGLLFRIVGNEYKINKVEAKNRWVILLYLMANGAIFLQTISGIRSALATTIVFYCIYMETVEGKSLVLHAPLYVFALFLHSIGALLIIIRFIFLVTGQSSALKKIFRILVGVALVIAFWGTIAGSLQYGSGYIDNETEYRNVWQLVISIIAMMQVGYVNIKSHELIKHGCITINRSLVKYSDIVLLICIMTLPVSYAVPMRLTFLATFISMGLLYPLLYAQNTKGKSTDIKILMSLSLVIFMLSILRGDLCGYKFFTLI